MTFDWRSLLDLIVGDPNADRVVPTRGGAAKLTLFVAAVMTFLTVLAFALSATAGRLADQWGTELAQAATLRLPADPDQADALLRAALNVLETTPGVASARALSADEQAALLEPWFGPDLPLEALPIPQLVEVVPDRGGYDAAGLAARLAAEVPGAVFDDHTSWRTPLIAAASKMRLLGWLIAALIAAGLVAVITLAAQASLVANARIIAVLRLIGARDIYIARAFVRRITLRTGAGAVIGTFLGVFVVLVLPGDAAAQGFLPSLGFVGFGWLLPLIIPPLAAIVAFFATRAAALRQLREQT